MALKGRTRLRVQVELPDDLPDEAKLREALKTRLYAAAAAALSEIDAGETVDIDLQIEEEEISPEESFKQGWADAMEGRTMSREEFRRRMSEDG